MVIIQYHTFVSGALALVIYGIVQLTNGHSTHTSATILKVGAALLIACYALLTGYTVHSFTMPRQTQASSYRSGSKVRYSPFHSPYQTFYQTSKIY